MDDIINVALVSYGYAAKTFHEPFINDHPTLKLTHIVSRRAEELAAEHPNVTFVTDVDALAEQSDVELVVVTSPNELHAQHAIKLLQSGKHVIVEKPFALDYAEAKAVVDTAQQHQRWVQVYQNRRWDGDFMTVRQLLRDNTLGHVHLFESYIDRYRPQVRDRWRENDQPGAGLLYDLGPHLLDQTLRLFGQPEAVFTEGRCLRDGAQTNDDFTIQLRYPQLTVRLGAGMLFTRPRPRFALYGAEATYIKHGVDPQEPQLKAGILPDAPGFGADTEQYGELTVAEEQGSTPVVQQAGHYRSFYQGIVDLLRHDAPPPVSPESSLALMALMDDVRRSQQKGKWVACQQS